jgi:DeoR/GlpR family transcriptional regulator of sugar metabolism
VRLALGPMRRPHHERYVLNEERRRAILETLSRDGRVLVGDLAKQFDTSQVTIRKDLDILQAHGRIHRTHGGALPMQQGAREDPTLLEKENLHRRIKQKIAMAAARVVQEGQVLILDSGTLPLPSHVHFDTFKILRSLPMP